jgi:hypothetical protein
MGMIAYFTVAWSASKPNLRPDKYRVTRYGKFLYKKLLQKLKVPVGMRDRE